MTKHLFGLMVTAHGTAANNRAESEGNIATLQKILWNGETHSTVSAEAIRAALRRTWQARSLITNRTWDDSQNTHVWQSRTFDATNYIDDDVLGFMSAQAGKVENTSEEVTLGDDQQPSRARKARPRGTTLARRGRLEVTRAISLTPWTGDVTFNAASVGATPSASQTGRDPVPYGTEVHATRYQYGFALTPEALINKGRALDVVDGLVDLASVAGNHNRFLFDFSPEAVVFRWTEDFAPRMLYGFSAVDDNRVAIPEVVRRIRVGDIEAGEVIVGGNVSIEDPPKGLSIYAGVKPAAFEVKRRIREDLGL
jgi:CRISPR-associated protein Cst2